LTIDNQIVLLVYLKQQDNSKHQFTSLSLIAKPLKIKEQSGIV